MKCKEIRRNIQIIVYKTRYINSLFELMDLSAKSIYKEKVDTMPEQNKAPLLEEMEKYADRLEKTDFKNFMDLGHKSTAKVGQELVKIWGEKALDHDFYPGMYVETLDNPEYELKDSLELAAKLYGTKKTFFSPCGATPLVAAMIAVTTKEGQKILMPRQAHKSIIYGMLLSGAIPVYMEPPYVEGKLLQLNTTVEQVEYMLNNNPDITTVFIISPTMYGIHCDVEAIAKIVHKHNKFFIVDEAWGALLPFCDKYPKSAIYLGADLVVHSNHKDGPAVVSSGLLHVCSDRINPLLVHKMLNEILTTSPSYWQVSSQDACRRFLAKKGYQVSMQAMEMAIHARNEINKIPGFYCPNEELCKFKGCAAYSPNRVVVFVEHLGLTGWEIQDILMKKYNIGVAFPSLVSFTPNNTYQIPKENWEALIKALQEISKNHYDKSKKEKTGLLRYPGTPLMKMTPRKVAAVTKEKLVTLKESLGKIVSEAVVSYPPGMAIIIPGETMSEDILNYLMTYLEAQKSIKMKGSDNLYGLHEKNTKIFVVDE